MPKFKVTPVVKSHPGGGVRAIEHTVTADRWALGDGMIVFTTSTGALVAMFPVLEYFVKPVV